MRYTLLFLCYATHFACARAQTSIAETDTTTQEIVPVKIRSYFSKQPLLKLTSSAKVITREVINAQMPGTLLPAINTTPGVRMEERSPGSYRLALRGSMIRSSFGIRNTKIYIDEIPLTDAGGNTYLNLLDPVGLQQIDIIKGPDGSLFGPNSGGVVRITPFGLDHLDPETHVLLSGGSFGAFNQQFSHRQQVGDNYQFSIDQGFMRSDGYRDNSYLNRKYVQTAHRWQYNPKSTLKLLGIYSNMRYGTPGGLTQAQFDENPRQSRPGSMDQQASIHTKTLLAGLIHEHQFNERWTHSASIFGNLTDFTNILIGPYETRNDKNGGVRTYVSYQDDRDRILSWQMQLGMEAQYGQYQINYYQNLQGVAGDLTDMDRLSYGQHFYFYRASATLLDRLSAEASIGLNFNNIGFHQQFPVVENSRGTIDFQPAWMPRLGLSYLLDQHVALRTSISRGYSPPTILEVLSPGNIINVDMQPEGGTNFEVGVRAELNNRRWLIDVSAYHYNLNDGIVRQLRDDGTEFFVNSGRINQRGVELLVMGQILAPNSNQFIRALHVSTALTYQNYRFGTYTVVENGVNVDHSGNAVTSIPKWISVNTLNVLFPRQIGINIMHNYTSAIPLNDANTTFAASYHLLQAKVHWQIPLRTHWQVQVFAGGDNLLNKVYSLGNDINAFGGRFFNPSPGRNYYGGLRVGF